MDRRSAFGDSPVELVSRLGAVRDLHPRAGQHLVLILQALTLRFAGACASSEPRMDSQLTNLCGSERDQLTSRSMHQQLCSVHSRGVRALTYRSINSAEPRMMTCSGIFSLYPKSFFYLASASPLEL